MTTNTDAVIDAFLAKALEGADEKLAEIAARIKRAELHENESICFKTNEASELLTLVTALSAEKESLRAEYKAIYDRCDKLESQLTAQKAAHAKMLRDEADVSDKSGRDRMASRVLRYIADKIEGGE